MPEPHREWDVSEAPRARQTEIYFRPESYSAFPHLIRLDGDELLVAFREAPRTPTVRHTHLHSHITLIRSFDNGTTWQREDTTHMGAGGGEELSLIYFGHGHVGGALAWHELVPPNEKERRRLPHLSPQENPFSTPGSYWVWSHTYGLTWPPHQIALFGPGTMPCGPPCLTRDGSLLCPVYHLENGVGSSLLYRSNDQGRTWSGPQVMAKGEAGGRQFCEPCVLEIAPGVLFALHRLENSREGADCFWANRSEDGGATWSAPQNTHIRSGACPRLLPLSEGRLLLTFGRRFPPYGIRAMLSEDGGLSWGRIAWVLRPCANANQGYTSSVELGGGRILTVSYAENEQGTTGIVGTFWDLPR